MDAVEKENMKRPMDVYVCVRMCLQQHQRDRERSHTRKTNTETESPTMTSEIWKHRVWSCLLTETGFISSSFCNFSLFIDYCRLERRWRTSTLITEYLLLRWSFSQWSKFPSHALTGDNGLNLINSLTVKTRVINILGFL